MASPYSYVYEYCWRSQCSSKASKYENQTSSGKYCTNYGFSSALLLKYQNFRYIINWLTQQYFVESCTFSSYDFLYYMYYSPSSRFDVALPEPRVGNLKLPEITQMLCNRSWVIQSFPSPSMDLCHPSLHASGASIEFSSSLTLRAFWSFDRNKDVSFEMYNLTMLQMTCSVVSHEWKFAVSLLFPSQYSWTERSCNAEIVK